MRITNKMLSNNFLNDMRTNLSNLNTIQGQITSGKQVRKPSDDPAKASKIMQINSDIGANKQYNTNIKNTTNWLDVTDTSLGQVGDAVSKIQDLLQSAGNGGYTSDELTSIKDVINQKVGELSQILNTSFDGKYIFGGTSGTSKPADTKIVGKNTELTMASSQGSNKLLVEVSQGVTMDYNITASQVINYGTGDNNLMKLLSNITSHLDSGDTTALTTTDLTGIKDAMTNVLSLRSEVGAKQNRMESAQARNEDQNYNMTEILSTTQDIDITEKAMEYATMQTVYTASLQTSAKVLQPTLLDYL
ncbi:flagellar hook-associated protein FlgL [Clostridium algoriphilum]|uniref:flagellar hook-associated protein FlgL n=1 Tax=Clostridium algoriphilum TaxID=198347 RepID=UPI001CF39137|nr:flagellar hook-associated protein FlgL [Clostridium algoriphilum]MCB2294281.1 flagellar hook-associated protein FlgL [Clostridium algoriphilum]